MTYDCCGLESRISHRQASGLERAYHAGFSNGENVLGMVITHGEGFERCRMPDAKSDHKGRSKQVWHRNTLTIQAW